MTTKQEIQAEIDEFSALVNDPNVPSDEKEFAKTEIARLQKELDQVKEPKKMVKSVKKTGKPAKKPIQQVYVSKERNKIVLIDVKTNNRWANEFFDKIDEALEFANQNKLQIVSTPENIAKKISAKTSKKSPKKSAVKQSADEPDCDDLLKQYNTRKKNQKKASKTAAKTPTVKKDEKAVKTVTTRIKKHFKSGDLTRPQIEALIKELTDKIKELRALLKSDSKPKKKFCSGGKTGNREKLFLVTDNNPDKYRRSAPVQRSASFIAANWDIEEIDEDEETLADFLNDSTRGQSWIGTEDTFENIGFVEQKKSGGKIANFNEKTFMKYAHKEIANFLNKELNVKLESNWTFTHKKQSYLIDVIIRKSKSEIDKIISASFVVNNAETKNEVGVIDFDQSNPQKPFTPSSKHFDWTGTKFELGGKISDEDEEIDLFEHYETLPQNVQDVLAEHSDDDQDYESIAILQDKLEALGYTFDYGLDAVPYNLRKMAKGGKVGKVMREFKKGKLRSGSKKDPVVKSRKQAIAIALSEERNEKNGKSNQSGWKHRRSSRNK